MEKRRQSPSDMAAPLAADTLLKHGLGSGEVRSAALAMLLPVVGVKLLPTSLNDDPAHIWRGVVASPGGPEVPGMVRAPPGPTRKYRRAQGTGP